MKGLILRNINIGVHKDLSKDEEKLVKLLNFICLIWYSVTILFIVSDYFIVENYLGVVIGYVLQVLLFFLVQFLQSKRKYFAARLLFVSFSHLLVFAFCNVIIPGNFVDLFYILTPLFGLMFFKGRVIHYTLLVLSILSFVVPNYLWHNYDPSLFSDPTTIPIFFISIFLLVTYFRNLNLKNEKRLNEQKDNALEDKKLIEDQKKELEDIHKFQNQFFINIAHEIRTPLTIIKGNITRLSQNEDQDIKDTLQSQLNKIQRIVKDVMDLAKMDTNEFSLCAEEVPFSSFVNTIFNSFYSSFQSKNIDYQLLDTSSKKNIVLADRIYLESAVSNILTNALKYTENNGQVSLLIEHENDQLILKIIDSGIGIPEQELAKIFNRFYQADNSINRSGGSGIGLAFSNEIIKKLNGSLTVKSKIGQGSTFIISLPCNKVSSKKSIIDNKQSIEKNEVADNLIPDDKQTILLVEDNKDMQTYIISVLNEYNVISAYNGIEGLEKLSNNKVDYIITDYMMPKMNGEEFIEKIKDDTNTLPILMLTAITDIKIKFRMLRLGIDDYITKPFEEEEILLRIKNGLKNYSNQQDYIKEENIQIEETRLNTITASFLNKLKEFVESNCKNENFGILDICDELAVSQSTLYRKVKSLTGLSTQEFITEVKLQKALQIFNQNELLTLKEIGYRVGFLNYTHFGKLFEQRFGKHLSEK